MTLGSSEVLRAVLPPPHSAHARAASTVLEGLSLWMQRPLYVVLSAGEQVHSPALGLCDGFGFGAETAHYCVEVIEPGRRRGLGRFADLNQIRLRFGGEQ